MTNYASGTQAAELSLVDAPASPGDAPGVTSDRSLELRPAGVSTPSGGEQSVADILAPALTLIDMPMPPEEAPSYSHPDAIAPSGAKPAQHTASSARRAHGSHGTADAVTHAATRGGRTSRQTGRTQRNQSNRKKLTLVAGVLGSLVAVAVGVVAMRSESVPAQQFNVAKAAPRAVTSGPSTSSGHAGASAADARGPLVAEGAGEDFASKQDFAGKLPALKTAGNWNVLVLYAGEWTRAQPGNADAWRELSMGYVKLRQLRDALDAANKVIQLAPDSFLAWQNLGKVNLALQEPAAALAAFERAATLNDQDVVSLVQAGMLDARLGRLPEAKLAFAKALALSPEDVGALCGSASIAQKEGRLKDAEAMAQQLKSLDGICRDPTSGESVQVVVLSGSSRNKTVSPTGR